jgi:hypothetical protein
MDNLEQAATNWAEWNVPTKEEFEATVAFKAGAEWQKEQYKDLIFLMRQLLVAYEIRHPDDSQLLVGYTNTEAFEKISNELERLQG